MNNNLKLFMSYLEKWDKYNAFRKLRSGYTFRWDWIRLWQKLWNVLDEEAFSKEIYWDDLDKYKESRLFFMDDREFIELLFRK